MNMTRKQRFIDTLEGKETDKIPVFDFLSSKKLFEHITGCVPTDYLASDIMKATIALNLDAAFIPYGGFAGYSLELPENLKNKKMRDDQYMDEWGTVYQSSGVSWPADAPVGFPVATRKDLDGFRVPDAHAPGRLDGVLEAIAMNEDHQAAILGGVNGPFTSAMLAMGLTNMSYSVEDDPELIPELMRKVNGFLIPAAEIMIKAGVDGIFIADDLGYKNTCFFRPDYMRKHILPEIERLARRVKELGSYALLHSCGNVDALLPDLVEMSLDAIHPIQQTAGMDLKEVKRDYGDKICIIGNVDSTNILPNGTVEDVKAATLECMKTGGKGGRFVLASDSDLRDDMPLENMLCMIETALNNNDFAQYNHVVLGWKKT